MLLLRLSPDTATVMAAGVAAMDTTARGRLRLSPAMATAAVTAMVVTVVVMVVTAAATTATARGLLSPATAMVATAMVATVVAMVATVTAGATATGVSYHQIRRSELSQKQNYKNS